MDEISDKRVRVHPMECAFARSFGEEPCDCSAQWIEIEVIPKRIDEMRLEDYKVGARKVLEADHKGMVL